MNKTPDTMKMDLHYRSLTFQVKKKTPRLCLLVAFLGNGIYSLVGRGGHVCVHVSNESWLTQKEYVYLCELSAMSSS